MTEIILERSRRLELRAEAHHLNVGVQIGEKGLTEAVFKEIDRALADHGLIKVHVAGDDRDERQVMYEEIADRLQAARIHSIGKMLVFWREPEDKNAKKAAGPEDKKSARPAKTGKTTKAAKAAGAKTGSAKRVKAAADAAAGDEGSGLMLKAEKAGKAPKTDKQPAKKAGTKTGAKKAAKSSAVPQSRKDLKRVLAARKSRSSKKAVLSK